ncbi:MAG: hypothetical protein J1E06_06315 [Acutalibacter sp.]|nr:hypothetical protein [Acutalibacter sp.]
MDFSGFLGNDEVKAALSAAFAQRRFPHAIVLQGESGTGKRTLAKHIAKALVCRDREKAPCGQCPSCIRAAAGSHPDIRVAEGSGKSRSLSVDTIKSITSDAYRMPEEADVNVYILLMGTNTSAVAQNKLLKAIEEPPDSAVFLLVCESAEQLLPTIRSRVQSFTLKPPPIEEAAAYVERAAGIDGETAGQLAALCGGNIGRMLEEAAGGTAAQVQEIAAAMVTGMMDTNEDRLLKAVVPLQKDRKLCGEVLSRLSVIFRDACVLRMGGTTLLGGAPKEADYLSGLPKNRLSGLPEIPEEFRRKLERNANMNLLLCSLCAKLREAAGK